MSADFAAARLNMLDSQVRPADVTDWALQDAIGAAPRESVVPAQKGFAAYADTEVEYAPGRWLLRPRDVSKLLQALRPEAGERALAIAAPYAALVLETMGLSVDRLDGETLTAVPGADYDLVIVEGAVAKAPEAWTAALAQGGRGAGGVGRKAGFPVAGSRGTTGGCGTVAGRGGDSRGGDEIA
jgi:protein-L-isoaspartate(D-aspartate) O-methyltransferase